MCKFKQALTIVCACALALIFFACGEKMSEEAYAVQRKIDKALESEPTYEDLIEIREGYDDLLIEEQETIQNYDQIQEKLKVTDSEVAAIYAINVLKDRLKNPSSLEIISAGVTSHTDISSTWYVEINYTAANDVGGNLEDVFYWEVEVPVYNENTDRWSCGSDPDFAEMSEDEALLNYLWGIVGGNQNTQSSQELARSNYEAGKDRVSVLSAQKLMDNIDLPIDELEGEDL